MKSFFKCCIVMNSKEDRLNEMGKCLSLLFIWLFIFPRLNSRPITTCPKQTFNNLSFPIVCYHTQWKGFPSKERTRTDQVKLKMKIPKTHIKHQTSKQQHKKIPWEFLTTVFQRIYRKTSHVCKKEKWKGLVVFKIHVILRNFSQ